MIFIATRAILMATVRKVNYIDKVQPFIFQTVFLVCEIKKSRLKASLLLRRIAAFNLYMPFK